MSSHISQSLLPSLLCIPKFLRPNYFFYYWLQYQGHPLLLTDICYAFSQNLQCVFVRPSFNAKAVSQWNLSLHQRQLQNLWELTLPPSIFHFPQHSQKEDQANFSNKIKARITNIFEWFCSVWTPNEHNSGNATMPCFLAGISVHAKWITSSKCMYNIGILHETRYHYWQRKSIRATDIKPNLQLS